MILGSSGIAVIQEGPQGWIFCLWKLWEGISAKPKPLFFIRGIMHMAKGRFAFRATERDTQYQSFYWMGQ